MIRLFASIFAVASLAAVLRAAPLDRQQVPADAKWLIHLDAEAAYRSSIGKAAIEAGRSIPAVHQGLANAQTMFGVDLTTDLTGITAYSTEYTPDSGVVIVRGKLNRERMMTMLRSAPNQKVSRLREHDVYSWTEGDMHDPAKPPHSSAAAFVDERTLIVGQSERRIRAALDVIDGKASSLKDSDSSLAHPAPADTILEAAVTGLSGVIDLPPAQSPIVRQCDSGTVWMGEHEGRAFVHAEVLARSEDVAMQIRNLLTGAQAMAQLQAMNHGDLPKVLAAVRVGSDGRAVTLDWQMRADEVLGILSTEIQRQFAPPGDAHPAGKAP